MLGAQLIHLIATLLIDVLRSCSVDEDDRLLRDVASTKRGSKNSTEKGTHDERQIRNNEVHPMVDWEETFLSN